MVQTQFKYFLDAEDLQQSFNDAVSLVYSVFPKQDDEKNQLYKQWARCNAYAQHVISLKDSFKECHEASRSFRATSNFCALLAECQRRVSQLIMS